MRARFNVVMQTLARPEREAVLPLADVYDGERLVPEPAGGFRIHFLSGWAEARSEFLKQARVVRPDFAVVAAADVASLPAEPPDAADAPIGMAGSMVAVVVDCRQCHALADAVFARLRAGTMRRHTHVTVLINAAETEKAWAVLCGADDVLVDPYTLLDLQLRLRTVCRAVRRQQDIERLSIDANGATGQTRHLRPLAYTDQLTGLPNRLYLDNWVAGLGTRRGGVGSFGIHLIALDGFEEISQRHGRRVGDLLLRTIGERLSQTVRRFDIVAHFGGGEIVALQLGAICGGDLRAFAGRLLAVFDHAFVVAGQSIRIDACIGSALYPTHGDSFSDLLHRADVAMEVAKSAGAGTFRMFQGSPGSASPPPPLADGPQATPCYGLAFSLAGGAFRGAYVEPGAGAMLAGAGDNAAIPDEDPLLDLAVAFTQSVRWSLVTCPLVFSASVDAAFFARSDAVGRVRDLLLETGADPARCEVTLRSPNGLAEVGPLHRLRDMGLGLGAHIEADTFMLQRMLRLPLTRLHLDHRFTEGEVNLLAEAAVRFARSIRARTLGYDISTREHMEALLGLGVDDVTGQYVSPLASNDKLLLLRRRIAAGQDTVLDPLRARSSRIPSS